MLDRRTLLAAMASAPLLATGAFAQAPLLTARMNGANVQLPSSASAARGAMRTRRARRRWRPCVPPLRASWSWAAS